MSNRFSSVARRHSANSMASALRAKACLFALLFTFVACGEAAWGQVVSPPPVSSGYGKLQFPASKTLVIYGDSFATNAGLAAAAIPCGGFCQTAIDGNYYTFADIYSGFRVTHPSPFAQSGTVTNCGVTGTTTAQILTNISCVMSAQPDLVLYEGGTNDANGSVSCATVTANNRAIYAQLKAAGITVIKTSVIPRSGGSAYTTAQANLAQCYNEYDRRYAEEVGSQGFYFVDLDPVVLDPTSASWAIKSGYLDDGVHPSTNGGSVMGYAIAQVINQLVPQWRQPIFTNGDVYDSVNNPTGNLLPNGAMTGSGGTATNACTGTVPTSVSIDGTSGGGVTCVGSVTTLADGRAAAVLTLSGAATGSARMITVRQLVATPANVNNGDVLEGQAWVSLGANSNISGVELFMSDTESATPFSNTAAVATQTSAFPTAGFATGAFVPLITPRRTTTAVPTQIFMDVRIRLINGSVSPTATLTVSSMSVRKVFP